jgi:hypothetical protein
MQEELALDRTSDIECMRIHDQQSVPRQRVRKIHDDSELLICSTYSIADKLISMVFVIIGPHLDFDNLLRENVKFYDVGLKVRLH